MAQEAGAFVLKAEDYMKECAKGISNAKKFLIQRLEHLGLSPIPSKTNFFLVKVDNATQFRQTILTKGILVRDCTSFGLPQYIRLAPRTLPSAKG